MKSNDLLKAWVHFLKNPESKEVEEYCKIYPEIQKAKEKLIEMSADPKMVAKAEARKIELEKNNK